MREERQIPGRSKRDKSDQERKRKHGERGGETGGSQANHEQAKREEVISGHWAQREQRRRSELKKEKIRGGGEDREKEK